MRGVRTSGGLQVLASWAPDEAATVVAHRKAAARGTTRRAPHGVETFEVGWLIERTMGCEVVVEGTRHLFTG
jgi:hypothetical protein